MVKNMTGAKIGRLTVKSRAPNNKYGDAMWNCVCDCGKEVIANGRSLRRGHTLSCGCLQRDINAMRCYKRGALCGKKEKLYGICSAMKKRCRNQNDAEYMRYGGRGICVCSEWMDYAVFRKWAYENGWKNGLTIDRIDNDKGYGPDNCRWATRAEQNRNTSRTHRIESAEGPLTASQVAEIIGVTRGVVSKWCRAGEIKTLDDAIEREKAITDVKHLRKKKKEEADELNGDQTRQIQPRTEKP